MTILKYGSSCLNNQFVILDLDFNNKTVKIAGHKTQYKYTEVEWRKLFDSDSEYNACKSLSEDELIKYLDYNMNKLGLKKILQFEKKCNK